MPDTAVQAGTTAGMKRVLLLGAGNSRALQLRQPGDDRVPEIVTLDIDPRCSPDVVFDLDELPLVGTPSLLTKLLPFADAEFDEIHAYEVLEHVGRQGDWRGFFREFGEYHRVLRPGGLFCGSVPYWRSVWAWGDPGHTRVISAETFHFLSQKAYADEVGKTPMTDYRAVWSGDFELVWSNEMANGVGGLPHPAQSGRFFFVLRRGA